MTKEEFETLRIDWDCTIIALERDEEGNLTGMAHVVGDFEQEPEYSCPLQDYIAVRP